MKIKKNIYIIIIELSLFTKKNYKEFKLDLFKSDTLLLPSFGKVIC